MGKYKHVLNIIYPKMIPAFECKERVQFRRKMESMIKFL